MKKCSKCRQEKDESLFSTDRGRIKPRCKQCRADDAKEYYRRNPERAKEFATRWIRKYPELAKTAAKRRRIEMAAEIAEYHRQYRIKNSAKRVAQATEWKRKNPEKNAAIRARHQKKTLPKIIAYHKKREADTLKATPSWANSFFIEEAYFLAAMRTKKTGIKWHVDHIVPLRSQFVCGLHTHTNLRVITAHENQRKNNRYWPDMPNQATA